MKLCIVRGVVALALLAGCSNYKATLDSYVGSPEGAVISEWGVPDSTYRADDGTRYLTYRRARTYQALDDVKLHGRCMTTFAVVAGKVTSWSYKGNDCR